MRTVDGAFEQECACLPMRYFLEVAFDGTRFHGWQEQENAIAVQQVINEALSKLIGEEVKCMGSGRTDTGVHATQQVIHFDAPGLSDSGQFCYQLNAILPKDIAIRNLRMVKPEAHARFDAVKRTYKYHIHTQKDPFSNGRSYFHPQPIKRAPILAACEVIHDTRDFESFSRVKTEVNHFDCEISEINWESRNDRHVFTVSANRFLRGMVRTMVGTLIDVGLGKLSTDDLALILRKKDRRQAGRAVPAHGLFLIEVLYPEDIYLKA